MDKRREVPMNEQAAISLHNDDGPAQTVGRKLDLEKAVEQLTDDQRQMVALKFTQGLSTNEVAEIMDRTPGAIRVLQFRELSALREILDGSGGAA
jgi:RNA polymerase sigma-70 factor (ECF subfamily)